MRYILLIITLLVILLYTAAAKISVSSEITDQIIEDFTPTKLKLTFINEDVEKKDISVTQKIPARYFNLTGVFISPDYPPIHSEILYDYKEDENCYIIHSDITLGPKNGPKEKTSLLISLIPIVRISKIRETIPSPEVYVKNIRIDNIPGEISVELKPHPAKTFVFIFMLIFIPVLLWFCSIIIYIANNEVITQEKNRSLYKTDNTEKSAKGAMKYMKKGDSEELKQIITYLYENKDISTEEDMREELTIAGYHEKEIEEGIKRLLHS